MGTIFRKFLKTSTLCYQTMQVQLCSLFFALFGRFSSLSGKSSATSSVVVMERFQSYTRPICFSFMFPLLQLGLEQFCPFSGPHPARQGRDNAPLGETTGDGTGQGTTTDVNELCPVTVPMDRGRGGETPGTVECGPTGAETFIMYLIHFTC